MKNNQTPEEIAELENRSAEIMAKALKGRKVIQEDIEPCELSFSQEQDKFLESDFRHYNS